MTFSLFVDAVLLCFACLETLCALELVHRSDVFYSSVLQFFCVVLIQSVQIAVERLRQGLSKGTCSPILSCDSDCLLQVILGRSHGNCYIMDAI